MKIRLGATLLGFSYMTLGLLPAYADDTDIFLGRVDADTIKPNILFILDNSGSMDSRVSGRSGPTRMEALKESMTTILNSMEGVNAGFMRFNAPGGSIMYPVADLDRPLDTYWIQRSVIEDSHDDAMQSLSGTTSVILDGSELILGGIPENLQTPTYDLDAGEDDAGQWRVCSGNIFNRYCRQTVTTDGNNIELDKDRINGFRFQNIDIDPDAHIYAAHLRFRSTQNGTGDLSLHLNAENSSNSSEFAAGDPSQNISDRALTNSSVTWRLDNWSNNQFYTSPDISALVREVVNGTDWTSGDALTIIQSATGSGSRRVASYEGNQPARLEIEYQAPGGTYASQHVGLRFTNVSVPQGARITNAYIQVTSSSSKSSEYPVELRIALENDPDADPFDGSSMAGASTISPAVNWDAGDWELDETVRTPSLIQPLQALVNDPDWCGGNAVAFHITPRGTAESSRTFYSADHGQGKAPRLIVEYDRNSVPQNSCNKVMLRYAVAGQPDDADQPATGQNRTVSNGNDNLRLDTDRIVGLRFANLPIKQGATVTDARMVLTAGRSDSDTARATIEVQDSVSPPNFPQNNRNISSRTFRAETVTWDLGDWEQNAKYRSPDISSLVNAIVQNNDWDPNANAIVFALEADSGSRRIRAVDWGAGGGAAVLEIKIDVNDLEGGLSDGRTVRDHLVGLIGGLESRTNTPIVDSLYEAARYYRGDSVYWATERRTEPRIDNRRYLRVSHLDALEPGDWELVRPAGCTEDSLDSLNCRTEKITGSPVYKSPIVESCQANYIVLLTDGEANSNYSADLIKEYIGHSEACQNNRSGEACSEELVEWMANNDMKEDVDGENTVHTFTIAFAFDDPNSLAYLQGLAQKGGGRHFTAGSEAELTNAFNTIIGEILDRSATFVVPGTTVSQFNRLSHYEDIFFSVFKPSRNPRWAGNLKKYKISRSETNAGSIVGQQDKPAVDASTGFFKEGVASFWSNVNDPDGPEVEKGGAASMLKTPDQRTVVTYYTDASTDLTNINNRLHPQNANLTKTMLNIPTGTDEYRERILRWARGEDVFDEDNDGSTDDIRLQFGDPLHSAPVSIAYGGTEENPDFSIFFGTNDGFLRAIDGSTGEEHFAFIPESLLPNLKILYENAVTDAHPYGVDGDITRWVQDGDGDPATSISEDGGFAYIYFGLRRGGQHYYALDVTDRNNPKLMWHIDGAESPYDELGQTWSQPLKARVAVKEGDDVVEKDVLIFGGGYDPAQDDAPLRQTDSQGRGIFMVEAGRPTSGIRPDLVWSAGPGQSNNLRLSDMQYAIPSIVRAGDTNGDGLVDVMFAADMGGQVWRFDVNNGQTADNLVTGGVIAEFAKDDDPKEARRFYAGVDASTIAYRGERFIALSLGSGWRANPLNEVVEDRFYMIRQPVSKPATYTKLTENDLYDATDNDIGSDDPDVVAEARTELTSKKGWYIKLERQGEKVLAPSVTAQAMVYFTTYRPGGRSDPCSPAAGTPYFYGVNIIDATPVLRNKAGELTRSLELQSGNIAPTPTFVILPDGTPLTLVGPEKVDPPLEDDPIRRTYWYED